MPRPITKNPTQATIRSRRSRDRFRRGARIIMVEISEVEIDALERAGFIQGTPSDEELSLAIIKMAN